MVNPCTSVGFMTSKSNNKKTTTKKSATKKAVAKKASPKKKSVSAITKNSTTENGDRSSVQTKLEQATPQFASAENFLKSAVADSSVVKANDIKSLPLRKKMLAWFKISK